MHSKGMKKPKYKYTDLAEDNIHNDNGIDVCSRKSCSTRIKKKLVYIKNHRPTLCYKHYKENK